MGIPTKPDRDKVRRGKPRPSSYMSFAELIAYAKTLGLTRKDVTDSMEYRMVKISDKRGRDFTIEWL